MTTPRTALANLMATTTRKTARLRLFDRWAAAVALASETGAAADAERARQLHAELAATFPAPLTAPSRKDS